MKVSTFFKKRKKNIGLVLAYLGNLLGLRATQNIFTNWILIFNINGTSVGFPINE